jgi:hypothetical protein
MRRHQLHVRVRACVSFRNAGVAAAAAMKVGASCRTITYRLCVCVCVCVCVYVCVCVRGSHSDKSKNRYAPTETPRGVAASTARHDSRAVLRAAPCTCKRRGEGTRASEWEGQRRHQSGLAKKLCLCMGSTLLRVHAHAAQKQAYCTLPWLRNRVSRPAESLQRLATSTQGWTICARECEAWPEVVRVSEKLSVHCTPTERVTRRGRQFPAQIAPLVGACHRTCNGVQETSGVM